VIGLIAAIGVSYPSWHDFAYYFTLSAHPEYPYIWRVPRQFPENLNMRRVAFINGQTAHMATVMKYTGGAWVFVGSANFSSGIVDDISLALDSNNTPYVAYHDYATGEKATVMKYTGSAWVPLGQAGFSANKINTISLALDSSNTPYVAYDDNANGGATVMKFSAAARGYP
jgi:hypothetical protein